MKLSNYFSFVLCLASMLVIQNCKEELPEPDVREGLVAEYLFNGSADDTSTKAPHGTVGAGATLTTDRAGTPNAAYTFDGSPSGRIDIAHNEDVDFATTQDFSVSLWVEPAAVQNDLGGPINEIIRKWAGDAQGYGFGVSYYNSTYSSPKTFTGVRYDGSGCANLPEARSDEVASTFHHVIFTKEGSTLSIYVDNVLAGTSVDDTTCETKNGSPLVIGRRRSPTNSRAFTGKIDDIRIYNRVLSSEERDLLFNM